MYCKRVAGLFVVLLLDAGGFKLVYISSTTITRILNIFQLIMPAEHGTSQFFHNFKELISDSPQRQHALAFSPSQRTTNTAIPANGKSRRSILEGALDYKITSVKISRPLITNRKNAYKSFSALVSSILNYTSGQDDTKRLMKFKSENLANDLNLTATKGEI